MQSRWNGVTRPNHPFDEHGAQFAQAGLPFYVCPGTSSWNSIGGRTDNALGNLRSAAENGLKHGASGYLNTDWGDNGHWQSLPISESGLCAWARRTVGVGGQSGGGCAARGESMCVRRSQRKPGTRGLRSRQRLSARWALCRTIRRCCSGCCNGRWRKWPKVIVRLYRRKRCTRRWPRSITR